MADIPLVVRVAANLDTLRANLAEGVNQIETTKVAMQQMSTAYDGSRAISQAGAVVAAIQNIGGVTKLTADEQAKANVVLQAGIDKYAALGKEAPPQMVALADATKQVTPAAEESNTALAGLEGTVIRLAERFLVYETLVKVFDFGKDVLASTSRLEELHLATGISIEDIQRLSYVGQAFGVDAEQMARGVEQLSAKLANGDRNATNAVQMLGLSVDALFASGPKEAFLSVADAVGRVEDPMLKNGIATELFGGKLAKILIPVLQDLRKEMDAVPRDAIISDLNVQRAHDFDVALEHLETRTKSWTITMLDGLAAGAQVMGFWPTMSAGAKQVAGDIELVADKTKGLTQEQLAANYMAGIYSNSVKQLTDLQISYLQSLKDVNLLDAEHAKGIGVTADQLKLFELEQKNEEEGWKASAEAAKKYAEAVVANDAVWSKFHIETMRLAGENEKKWHDDAMKLLAIRNGAIVSGFEQIRQAQQSLSDFEDQSWMSSTDFQVKKIWERAAAEIASFKGTEEQRAQFNSAILTLASDQADALYAKDAEYADKTLAKLGQVADAMSKSYSFASFALNPANGDLAAQAAARGGTLAYDSYHNPYVYIPGVSAPPPRADGGPVSSGTPYMVGERGPELFVPSASGSIVPNGAMGGGDLTVTTNLVVDGRVLTSIVNKQNMATLRGQGMRTVSGA